MYPRNATTPPSFSIGAVVLIADGTVQESDVLIKVKPEGGSASAGGGTVDYVEGVVHYAPTQAETDYTAFTVTAYKADCLPAAVTIVTTASATAGYALVPDTQKVDVNTIKTKAITADSAITMGAYVGSTAAAAIAGDAMLVSVGTGAGQINVSGGVVPASGDWNTVVPPSVAQFNARSLASDDYFVTGDYTAPLDAEGIRTAVGLSSANIDTQLSTIKDDVEFADPDLAMLGEAIRQGYDPERDVIVQWADTDAGRGINLKAALAAIRALTPTESSWCTLFLPPWHYLIATSTLAIDTDYIHFTALYPEMGGRRKATDYDVREGTTSLESFRPPKTLIYAIEDGLTTVTQSAQYTVLNGFGVAQLSGYGDGAYHAYYIDCATNAGSRYDTMYFWHKAPMTSSRTPVGCLQDFDGIWSHVIANASAYRIGKTTTSGQFKAHMYDTEGGFTSYIGDYNSVVGKGTHKASGCYIKKAKEIGIYSYVDLDTEETVYREGQSFGGCTLFGNDIDSTCYFEDIVCGDKSCGIGCLNEGTWVNVRGGADCMGGTTSNTYPGEFAGKVYDSIFGANSCGGNASGATLGKCSGLVKDTAITGNTSTHRCEGATLLNSTITIDNTYTDCITLLDSNSKVHDCTLLPVEGGTGVPINAASSLSVSAQGNTYGNKTAAANGIGSNVTTTATIDVVPKVTVSDTATTVTNKVTTDDASRNASKADVSPLATSEEVTALQSHGDGAWQTATGFATESAMTDAKTVIDGIAEDTGTTLPAAIANVEVTVDEPALAAAIVSEIEEVAGLATKDITVVTKGISIG